MHTGFCHGAFLIRYIRSGCFFSYPSGWKACPLDHFGQVPSKMISWESTSGLKNAGVASFSSNKNTMEGQTSCNVAAGGPNHHAVVVELKARHR